ncbi:dTDP-4-dehydrorhamnose 3,5-epimerase [Pseudodesulfovibrio tunisiensis]|uniref:dTDP-4-dehydrorhamnose 3,5-epimerase n=1 Tax=Pseudodesulfovibrio tunisiensis TaxID=463192 RepID=UPI001FB2BFB2|nr:dTDP-4-dehydrorhamnose 3,5-epimerase [Pseudodesulfovibrio tunisiensis]
MQVKQTDFPGLLVLEPRVFRDERGFFLETYSKRAFAEAGISCEFVQDNHAFSREAGVLRGFHFQRPPAAQAKLVWVTAGAVLDVVIDLRKGSPTFGRTYGIELRPENFTRMFIPKGFGHAYVTLVPDTEFMYKVDAPYTPECDSGIAWNDPDIGMDWESLLSGRSPILSEKDRAQPAFADFESPFIYEE